MGCSRRFAPGLHSRGWDRGPRPPYDGAAVERQRVKPVNWTTRSGRVIHRVLAGHRPARGLAGKKKFLPQPVSDPRDGVQLNLEPPKLPPRRSITLAQAPCPRPFDRGPRRGTSTTRSSSVAGDMGVVIALDAGTTGSGPWRSPRTERPAGSATGSSRSTSPGPAGSSTTPRRSGRRSRPPWPSCCGARRAGGGHRHHQPARDHRGLGPGTGRPSTGPSSGRTGAPPGAARQLRGGRAPRPGARPHRAGARPVLLGHKLGWLFDRGLAASAAGPTWRSAPSTAGSSGA